MRRVILLISVDWVPPSLRPSGACLTLGSRVLYQPRNAAEGSTTPGLRLCRGPLDNRLSSGVHPLIYWTYSVTGTSLAMAPMQPASARAMATVTT